MTYHDDTNTADPDGGYCPECLDIEMEVVNFMEYEHHLYMTLRCTGCGLVVEWQSDDLSEAPTIPPYEA